MSKRLLRPDGLPHAMTLPEVCEYLGLSKWTVGPMLQTGELRGNKSKHVWRIDTESVVAWLRGDGRRKTGT